MAARRELRFSALLLLASLATGCSGSLPPIGDGPPDQPATHKPKATGTHKANPSTHEPTVSGAPPDDSRGTPSVTFRGTSGSDHVACPAIQSEFLVTAFGGRMNWSARAGRRTLTGYPFVDDLLDTVTLDPTNGTLEEGQSTLVRVGGHADVAASFFVAVAVRNGAQTIEFLC